MLRNDGEYVFYIIQFQLTNKRWGQTMGGPFEANIPEKLRHKRLKSGHSEQLNPTKAFGASSDDRCWQETGNTATFSLEQATLALALVARYNPGTRFRVAGIKTTQQTVVIAETYFAKEKV